MKLFGFGQLGLGAYGPARQREAEGAALTDLAAEPHPAPVQFGKLLTHGLPARWAETACVVNKGTASDALFPRGRL